MTESAIYNLLLSSGFNVPSFVTFSVNEYVPEIDFFPVALKIESPKVIHKSDVGGVMLHIDSQDDLEMGTILMRQALASHKVMLDDNDHFLVSSMIEGFELYAGVVDDPIFGKTIVFGRGGIFLELDKDICYIHSHATHNEIEYALSTLKIAKLFEGYRGVRLDKSSIIAFIKRLQHFIARHCDIVECDFNPIKATDTGLMIVDARIKKGTPHAFRQALSRPHFFDNRVVAILGASTNPHKVGYAVAKNSLSFQGKLYFINARGGELFGHQLFQTLNDVAENIDTGVVCLPSEQVAWGVEELGKHGCKNVIVISAGFKECGNDQGEKEIGEIAQKYNMNLIGPNCLGYYCGQSSLNLTFAASHVTSGGLALLSQSGAVLTALMDKAEQFGIGFSHIISIGNMADMAFGELVMQLNDDPSCTTIAIYAEGIQNGPLFLEALRQVAKPIFIFKAGQTGEAKKAAFSHTGNLSGDYTMFKELIAATGVTIANRIESLLFTPLIQSSSSIIITNAGGPASIFTDGLIKAKAKLYPLSTENIHALSSFLPTNWSYNNPIDIIGDAEAPRFEQTLLEVLSWEGEQSIFVIVTPQFMTNINAIAQTLLTFIAQNKKPIIPLFLGGVAMQEAESLFKHSHALFFESIEEALAVFN